ncbi:hypothetical protein ZOSMA_31G01310 [Zostera marina]|uniref:PHD-type zinc finger plants domain-containing protein n=1 Tax=Zostera marina TaxID=29655 RepID=A0A0K9PBB6_ZOSMR|nr:hypothetical protein ZOSMA_31G01310 [Zostera marina]
MVYHAAVCCLCGDFGFSEKLFRCERCFTRFQHTYCRNYYEYEEGTGTPEICDWCRSEGHNIGKQVLDFKRSSMKEVVPSRGRSNYVSCERIKQNVNHEEISGKGKNLISSHTHSTTPSSSSSKSTGRRYKLLKDVLC